MVKIFLILYSTPARKWTCWDIKNSHVYGAHQKIAESWYFHLNWLQIVLLIFALAIFSALSYGMKKSSPFVMRYREKCWGKKFLLLLVKSTLETVESWSWGWKIKLDEIWKVFKMIGNCKGTRIMMLKWAGDSWGVFGIFLKCLRFLIWRIKSKIKMKLWSNGI
jgi:hypothetical protein